MPKVTSIERQKTLRLHSGRGAHRFNIYLDGQFSFGADEDLVVDKRLVVGKEVSGEQLEKLLFEAEVGKIIERVYGLLNIRLRSEKEIRDYLKKKKISEVLIELVVKKLKQKGLIDDLQFAKAWVQSKRRNKQKGVRAIKSELFQKGIKEEVIENVVDVEDDKLLAQQALQKKLKRWQNLDPHEFRKKAYPYLLRKGFEFSLVRDIIETVLRKRNIQNTLSFR